MRHRFGHLLTWINEGKEIQITMRRRVIARLIPDKSSEKKKIKMPDFAARRKKVHGSKVLSAKVVADLLAENKGRY